MAMGIHQELFVSRPSSSRPQKGPSMRMNYIKNESRPQKRPFLWTRSVVRFQGLFNPAGVLFRAFVTRILLELVLFAGAGGKVDLFGRNGSGEFPKEVQRTSKVNCVFTS